MRELCVVAACAAIPSNGKSVVSKGGGSPPPTLDVNSAVDDEESWFSNICRRAVGPKAGTFLHFLTGFDERMCQRYAAGHVKVPGYLVREIIRSPEGENFLNFVMRGANPPWWREYQRRRRITQQVDNLDLS